MVLYTIIKYELKSFWTDRVAVIMYLTLPFLFIWLFIQAFSPYLYTDRFSEKFNLAIVDQDKSAAAKLIVKQFESVSYLRDYIQILHTDQGSALSMLKANNIAGIIMLPPDFIDSIYRGDNAPLIYIGNKSQQAASDLIKNQLISATNLVSAGQSGVITVLRFTQWGGGSRSLQEQQLKQSLYKFTLNSFGRNRIFIEKTVSAIPDVNPAEYFTAAITVIFATFLGISSMKSLINEQVSGLRDRFMASPVEIYWLIGGKFCATYLLVVTQITIMLITTGLVFGNYLGGAVVNTLLVVAVSAFAVSAWSIFVASISPTPQTADLLGYLGTLILAVIGGNIYPLMAMPKLIKVLSNFTYNKWAMAGFLKLFSGAGSVAVTNEVLGLLTIGIVLLIGATGVFTLAWRR